MKVSMNGFRRQLTGQTQELRDTVLSVVTGEFYDDSDLIDAMNNVTCMVNALNCMFSEDDPDFTDMGHLEVPLIERE